MGTYDRSLQWRMMQQRHPHSSLAANPYFASGFSALGTTAGGERRSASLQALCSTATSTTNSEPLAASTTATSYNYAPDDQRHAPMMKRQRLSKSSPGGPTSAPRANSLASYLTSSSSESNTAYSNYQQTSSGPSDSYGSSNPTQPQEYTSEWFPQRATVSGSQGLTVNTSNSYASGNETSSSGGGSSLPRQSSLASPTTMFGMENIMADYESGFYSLWNGPNGPNVMGYDGESTPTTDRQSQVYMPEEELKMDYPQLPDLNQGDLEYIYGTMDSVTGRNSEPHIERAYASSSSSGMDLHRGTKRDRASPDDTSKLGSGLLSPTQTSLLSPLAPSGFRHLARATTIETKRPAPRSQTTYGGDSSSSAQSTAPISASTSAAVPSRRPSSSSSASAAGAKRPRSRQCDFPGCENRARSHQKCKKHGGAHQCVYEGCMKNSQSRGLCIAHGGGSRCKIDGCTRASQSKGRCKSHGGGEYCAVEGCRKKAHLKHLCRTHGGGVRCKDPKCMKWAQRKGWCMAHAKEVLGT